MSNTTHRHNDQIGCVSQKRHLSFYEENYILEPDDANTDNGYFQFEGEIDSDAMEYFSSYEVVA